MANIFLDKSLPKGKRILLQIVRVVLLTFIFGGFFYASSHPVVQDFMLWSSIVLAIVFIVIKVITERRRKTITLKKNLNNFIQGEIADNK